jgi:hypothetical protein
MKLVLIAVAGGMFALVCARLLEWAREYEEALEQEEERLDAAIDAIDAIAEWKQTEDPDPVVYIEVIDPENFPNVRLRKIRRSELN